MASVTRRLALALALSSPVALAQSEISSAFLAREPSRADLEYVRAQVRFLADDLLEGRGPGTRGGDLAARYLASQLELLGLKPGAADGSYFQKVPLLGIKTDYAASRAELVKSAPTGEETKPLAFLDDFVAGNESQVEAAEIDAEIVYVGYGIAAPEQQWDDYKGVDVNGKVLLMLVNDPPSDDPKVFGGKGLTYYGRWTYKYEEAARRGAVGAILMHRDDLAGYGWNVVRTSFARERPYVDVRGDKADGKRHLTLMSWANEAKTKELVALAGKNFDELFAAAAKKEFRPEPLGVRLRARIQSSLRPIDTANVVGVLPGAHRPEEAVIYSAHYDHLGIDESLRRDGKDGIFNGAIDNATGCAALLWIAREAASQQEPPDRSFVFLFTTAEEGGLRGSQYYAEHPTFAADRIAANINLDGLVVVGEPMQYEPLGYDRSSLKRHVELAAREFSVELVPDSSPHLGVFYRSDHFSFARAGIPAINMKTGKKLKGVAEEIATAESAAYTKDRYHQPSDEYDAKWDFAGLVKTARFAGRIGWRVAREPGLPRYNAGDEFARPAAK